MPYLAVIDGVPTMVADAAPAQVAPPAPAPVEYARMDDTIVLRPHKPLKIIRFEDKDKEEEVELEVREIENTDVADAPSPIEEEPEPEPVAEEPEQSSGSDDEYSDDLLEVVGEIHRHPVYTKYGGNLTTGEIFNFDKKNPNKVGKLIAVSIEKGCILSIGYVDGKRQQKYITQQQFIADCGKLKKKSVLHNKLKIDTNCEAYKKRPFVRFYPLACLSYHTENGKEGIKDIASVSAGRLVAKVKTITQIDDFVASFKDEILKVRRENARLETLHLAKDAMLLAKDAHIQKQNDEINRLKDEIERYKEHSNSPLKAGAVQLQELLMTEHQGSTVMEMLGFCFKDITRGCIKEDNEYERSDADADFGIFEMSPRGLFNRNEIVARQVD
jgi:hypothetical protein